MKSRMTIGDFSRATRLSAKALRFYHRQGILRPADVDPDNGYRWYDVEQIADAQVVRQLRDLEVPVDTIRDLLGTEDVVVRNELIAAHLLRLEARLDATSAAVASLRGLLEPAPAHLPIEHRSVPATPALVVRDTIDLAGLGSWYTAAWSMLDDAEAIHEGPTTGPRGGLWDTVHVRAGAERTHHGAHHRTLVSPTRWSSHAPDSRSACLDSRSLIGHAHRSVEVASRPVPSDSSATSRDGATPYPRVSR